MMKNAHETKVKKRSPVKITIILVIVALLLTGLVFAGREAYRYYQDANVLVDHAEGLKAELKALVTHVEKGNYEAANLSVQKVDTLSAEMRQIINDERWKLIEEKAPKYGDDLKTAQKFLDVVDEASNTLIKPAIKYLREKGLPSKDTFTKINPQLGNTLIEYADLIDELCPAVEKVLNDFNALPQFEMEKLESKVSKYRVLARDNTPEILTYLKFAKKTSDEFLRPAAKFLIENGNSLKLDFSIDKVGPEMASQILVFADGIDQLVPIAENTLKEVNTLPEFKIEKIEKKISKYRKLAKDNEADILSLTKFVKEISSGVIRPAADVMKRSPMSNLKTKEGDIDTKVIRDYLALVDTVKPYLNRANDIFKTNKLLKDHPKQTAKITSKIDSALDLMEKYNRYVPLINVVLGDGSDKTYLLMAQNSAEMRSCGGLPASMGVITIKNGILHIGDFKPVLDVVPWKNKGVNKISKLEKEVFQDSWYGEKLTACTVNPHFPRIAELISTGYKKQNKKRLDGIISMTPEIVGRLVPVTGQIKLSNGVKLDEKYAVKYLQRDIYFQYYTKKTIKDGKLRRKADDKANGLFAEAAKKTIGSVMSELNVKTILKLLEIIEKAGNDRIFMMWMADKAAEQQVKDLGFSGALNYDEKAPELGVFFSVRLANKMGIYVDINVKYGKEKVNKDGSVTYPVTVKIKDNIDKTSIKKGGKNPYLTSKYGPDMRSLVIFTAPKGGKITSFKNNSKLKFKSTTYQGLQLYYNPDCFWIKAGKTVTWTFNVTTAPGVNVKPKIVKTPLLSAFRNAKAPK